MANHSKTQNLKSKIPTFPFIQINQQNGASLYQQIYSGLQEAILHKQLPAGTRLPSSRELAGRLGVSRNTVVNALQQLVAEGYLETRPKSGTFVCHQLPEELLRPNQNEVVATSPTNLTNRQPSKRGQRLQEIRVSVARKSFTHQAFAPGMPAFDQFPFALWAKLMHRQNQYLTPNLFSDNSYASAGFPPLRQAIADHLRLARGVRCEPEQVVIVSGSQQGLYLAAQVLCDVGDKVWLEEPGYLGARGAFLSAGAEIVPVPVGVDGMDVNAINNVSLSEAPYARCAYVTPSHQFPLGYTMSLTNRLNLLNWAEQTGAWIVEDDYDSEYRYNGQPIPALQGLDQNGRVIYAGTFSKVMFPSLRIGYLVVPPDLVEAFVAAKALVDLQSPNVAQAALAEFMTEGHFVRHIRRMRTLYATRANLFAEQVEQHLAPWLTLGEIEAGMHAVGLLKNGLDDQAVARVAGQHQVELVSLSSYYLEKCRQQGFVLGFTGVTEQGINAGIQRLKTALTEIS